MAPQSPSVYVCRACSVQIRTNAYKIQCYKCKYWFHRDCANLSIDDIQHYLKEEKEKWVCNTCLIVTKAVEPVGHPEGLNIPNNSQVEILIQENNYLKRLIKELEEKNTLLFENKHLLEDKVVQLELKIKTSAENSNINKPKPNKPHKSPDNRQPPKCPPEEPQMSLASSSIQLVSQPKNSEVKEIRENDWQAVQRRRKKPLIGTAKTDDKKDGDNDNIFTGKEVLDKKVWLFISNVKDSVNNENIKRYIKNKANLGDNDVIVQSIATEYDQIRKDCKCFKVGVKFDLKDTVYQQDFWPQGVSYRRYKFSIQHKNGNTFLGNTRNEARIKPS